MWAIVKNFYLTLGGLFSKVNLAFLKTKIAKDHLSS